MKPRLKGSLFILAIILALAFPGAYGANFVGNDNGGSYSAAVSASTGGAVSLNSIGSANPHFSGTDAKKVQFSKKWTTGGNTFSEVGFLLRNTQSYDVTVNGGADKTLKTTNAVLDLQATADYINAYGRSGTANLYKAGVDLTVDHGSADIIITTNADGIAKSTEARLVTNNNAGHDNTIAGSTIRGHAYYSGGTTKNSIGDVWTYVRDGTLTGYGLLADSTASGSYARQGQQSGFSAFGDYLRFTTDATKAVGGVNKEAKTSTEITDGYIDNYWNYVSDNWAHVPAGMAHLQFSEAGTSATDGISIKNIYTESSKGLKIQAEQDAAVTGPGTLTAYQSNIQGPLVNQGVNDAYAGNPNNGANVAFKGYYKKITGSLTRQMYSETTVTNGELKNFYGLSSDSVYAGEFGTKNTFTSAQGSQIYLDNKYTDNKKGYKEATVTATDPSGALTGTIADSVGGASSDGTTQDVRVQGHTVPVGGLAALNVQVDAYKYYNQHATASYHAADPWFNYFLGYVDDPVAAVGHFTTGATGDTIQDALNIAPNINGVNNNLFLDTTTYSGLGNYNIVNNIGSGNNQVEKSFTLWGAGSYIKGAGNSVIDAEQNDRLFYLTSHLNSQTFNFKNIDFNNGMTSGNGGAMYIDDQPNVRTATVNIEYSNFNNNIAAYGGAIENDYETLHIKNCVFNNNHASTAGGAIRNAQGVVTIDNSQFTGNYANVGGAIAQSDKLGLGQNGGSSTLNGCTFTDNHADHGDGGAIFNGYYGHATTAPTVNANGCTFTGNYAEYIGVTDFGNGGAYAATTDYTQFGVNGSHFNAGTNNIITNSVFTNNIAYGATTVPSGLGAAIYIKGVSTSTLDPNSFSGNLPAGHNKDIVT